jgi:CelD/BcsL family acetyltransferase involved in cellulose biosynthesis
VPKGSGKTASALTSRSGLVPVGDVPAAQWRQLADNAAEPDAYALAEWAQTLAAAPGREAIALTAWRDGTLTGIVPVRSLWRALRIPLPGFVTADPFNSLSTPLLASANARDAADQILQQARAAGARALLLRPMTLDGPVMAAFRASLAADGIAPRILRPYQRALLHAVGNGDDVLAAALSARKLKDLRRQRVRLGRHGTVAFSIATTPGQIGPALETFLRLEASGWKGRSRTAMAQNELNADFIRRVVPALAERGHCEIVTLHAGETPVAAGIVLRHLDRAFFFKIGIDEQFSKYSPGVQLTLDLTRHLCADPAITSADSTASPGHPMIDPIWRGRLAVGEVLLPLYRRDPVVLLIAAAIAARHGLREGAKRALQRLKQRRR